MIWAMHSILSVSWRKPIPNQMLFYNIPRSVCTIPLFLVAHVMALWWKICFALIGKCSGRQDFFSCVKSNTETVDAAIAMQALH